VLPGLRHHAVIGRHHQQCQVDAGGPGHHVAHEVLVAGNVHHADDRAVGQGERGEAQVDGDAALFFLGESVGVATGESFDQHRLAVVDVSGGADDQVAPGGVG